MKTTDRRTALIQGSVGGLFAMAGTGCISKKADPLPFSKLGACASVDQAWGIQMTGADYIEESVKRLLVPDKPEDAWQRNLSKLKESPLPVEACNNFLPGSLRSTGPDANHEGILKWSEITFRRGQQGGVKVIVFGSSASRKRADGYPKEQAMEQFVSLLKKMGPMAERYGIIVAVEPLRRKECNLINTVLEGAAIVEQVNHPNIRLVSDWYHMMQNGEDPNDLLKVGHLIAHVHIAEKETRSAPGIAGDDFRPFFSAFKQIGYSGRLSVEGTFKVEDLPLAFQVIRKQARDAAVS